MFQKIQQGGVDVLQLGERLTIEEIEQLRPQVLEALPVRLPQVVIDLHKVKLVDSSALELLCDIQSLCAQRGGVVKLAGANPLVTETLRITGLDQQFARYHDVVAAAGEFAR